MNSLNNIITNELKKQPCIKRIYGVVTEVIKKNLDSGRISSLGKCKVRLIRDYNTIQEVEREIENQSIDTSKDITLLNWTKEELRVGDHVWIHYWNTVTDGYIAIKVGLSVISTPETIPYYRTLVDIVDIYTIGEGDNNE